MLKSRKYLLSNLRISCKNPLYVMRTDIVSELCSNINVFLICLGINLITGGKHLVRVVYAFIFRLFTLIV